MEEVARFDRAEFVQERWDHKPGEHVTILAPTGWGKTTLAFDLLGPISTPEQPSLVLVMKKRDSTVSNFAKRYDFRRVAEWDAKSGPPFNPRLWQPRKPPGWLLWPRFTGDPDVDEAEQYHQFRAALRWGMNRGQGVKVFADELADLKDIGLEREVSHSLRQGRSLRQATIGASQRPFNIPSLAYGQAMHLFIGNDTDKRSRDRYVEIGGLPKELVIENTQGLAQFEWLYIRRARGKTLTRMCIVGP